MKKSSMLSFLFFLFFAVSCSLTPTQKPTQDAFPTETDAIITPISTITETLTPQSVQVTIDLFKNVKISTVELKKEIQLTDGKWSETQPDGSIQMVMLDNHFAVGDLNSDGFDDAVVIVAESMGGTGVFYSVIAFVKENDNYVQKGSAFIDDRPIIHSLEIINDEIILNANVHGLNDPMVDPTVNLTKAYRIFGKRLITFRQTQLLDDGMVREINITAPEDYAEVGREVSLSGNMPIAPFENNLLVQVFGVNTNTSFTSSMMVDAADMGMPATFTTKISLDRFTSGELVIIQLVEVSMADGSSMTLDSVIVMVK